MSITLLNKPPVRHDFNDGVNLPPSAKSHAKPSAYYFTFQRDRSFNERWAITTFSRFFSGIALRQVTSEPIGKLTSEQRDAYTQLGAMRMTRAMCRQGSLEIGPFPADTAVTIFGHVESYLLPRCNKAMGRLPFRLDKK